MRERPILFSAPMVRAILDGRKTQTRRVVKGSKPGQPLDLLNEEFTPAYVAHEENGLCPYGVAGDRLWVKETWRPRDALNPWDLHVRYAADGAERLIADGEFGERDWTMPKAAAHGNVSPLFMPRWASRITLQITDVRIERLSNCSETDAAAEGLAWVVPGKWCVDHSLPIIGDDPRAVYAELWDHINGPGSWAANPWVWVVSFEQVSP